MNPQKLLLSVAAIGTILGLLIFGTVVLSAVYLLSTTQPAQVDHFSLQPQVQEPDNAP